MSSIVLSFVGNQDPYSATTNQLGSIISLIQYLIGQQTSINSVILLYTQGTKIAAEDTKEYLLTLLDNFNLDEQKIELTAVDPQLSKDPVDVLLATETAKTAINKIKSATDQTYCLELNASSGTPAMKSAWSILQAAGYAPHSRIWQVRNPKTQNSEQKRIFQTDLNFLRREFDLKIIKQQLENYDYSGALITFQASSLTDNGVGVLLKYGAARSACAFSQAWDLIRPFPKVINNSLQQQSKKLAQYHHQTILAEIYFQVLIKSRQQAYSELLVKVVAFEENVLRLIIKQQFLSQSKINTAWDKVQKSEVIPEAINKYDNGQLAQFLKQRNLDFNRGLSCPLMMAIAEYCYAPNSQLITALKQLDRFREQRNDYIHQLKGLADLNDSGIVEKLKSILNSLNIVYKPNPFDLINKQAIALLESSYI